MDTLEDIRSESIATLQDMKSIGEDGPSEENAKKMIDKMYKLQEYVNRIDNLNENE